MSTVIFMEIHAFIFKTHCHVQCEDQGEMYKQSMEDHE